MKIIERKVVCDICQKEIKPTRFKFLTSGARLRFWKKPYSTDWGDWHEYDVCADCFKKMMDVCQGDER